MDQVVMMVKTGSDCGDNVDLVVMMVETGCDCGDIRL